METLSNSLGMSPLSSNSRDIHLQPPEGRRYFGNFHAISGETPVSHGFPEVGGGNGWKGTCLCGDV